MSNASRMLQIHVFAGRNTQQARLPCKVANTVTTGPNHSETEPSNGFEQNGCHSVQSGMPLKNQRAGYHWNSERYRAC